jgi:hypothetical protein
MHWVRYAQERFDDFNQTCFYPGFYFRSHRRREGSLFPALWFGATAPSNRINIDAIGVGQHFTRA